MRIKSRKRALMRGKPRASDVSLADIPDPEGVLCVRQRIPPARKILAHEPRLAQVPPPQAAGEVLVLTLLVLPSAHLLNLRLQPGNRNLETPRPPPLLLCLGCLLLEHCSPPRNLLHVVEHLLVQLHHLAALRGPALAVGREADREGGVVDQDNLPRPRIVAVLHEPVVPHPPRQHDLVKAVSSPRRPAVGAQGACAVLLRLRGGRERHDEGVEGGGVVAAGPGGGVQVL
mmetsp:Transcript_24660/g.47965  ORF Transcript_24660/g.47965 Transcript_24660/m.47965 type:complete len:230 (+) Transcript_24660:19-708(+)